MDLKNTTTQFSQQLTHIHQNNTLTNQHTCYT